MTDGVASGALLASGCLGPGTLARIFSVGGDLPFACHSYAKIVETKASVCYDLSMKRDEAISRLQQHEAELKQLGVEHLYMFGSTARGEAREDSGVDFFSIMKKASSANFLMTKRIITIRLADIIEAIGRIRRILDGVTLEAFKQNWEKRWLVERGFEILSEAFAISPKT